MSPMQQEQPCVVPRLGGLEMSKQACPLAAGTIVLRVIAKRKEPMTLCQQQLLAKAAAAFGVLRSWAGEG